jgi:transcriptional regulator GlxA family with amidase domain
MEYLLRRRLDRAQDLLASSSDLIAQIASRCGFSDGNYFIRVYKKRFGISPAASRKVK